MNGFLAAAVAVRRHASVSDAARKRVVPGVPSGREPGVVTTRPAGFSVDCRGVTAGCRVACCVDDPGPGIDEQHHRVRDRSLCAAHDVTA